jgi:hypothetical protein
VYRRRPERVAELLQAAGFAVQTQLVLDLDQSVPGAILFARPGRQTAPETPDAGPGDPAVAR